MAKRRMGDDDADEAAAALRSQQPSSSISGFRAASSALPSVKRSSSEHAAHESTAAESAASEWLRPVDVKAFGLEDRAEAVIAVGRNSWSLAHLSRWRSESLSPADAAAPQSARAYVRERQRAYMKQCLSKPAT